MFKNLFLAFIPLFVAVDAVGVLPIFVSLTQDFKKEEKGKIIIHSMITATCLAVAFIFLGKGIFRFLGVTMSDFMIAGGVVLFSIAMMDILRPGKRRRMPAQDLGAVPIGTPLIVGPAVLTTSLIIIEEYGAYVTLIAVVVNILLAGLIFSLSSFLIKVFGEAGSKAISKIASLLLAAIAVMIIRKGIAGLF